MWYNFFRGQRKVAPNKGAINMARKTKEQMEQAMLAERLEREALWYESSMGLLDIIQDHMEERGASSDEILTFWEMVIREVRNKRLDYCEKINGSDDE